MTTIRLTAKEKSIWVYVTIFFIYSTFGSICEHLSYYFTSTKTKILANPILEGFPLYALGAYFVVYISRTINYTPSLTTIIPEFLLYGVTLTLVEYFAGLFVKAGSSSNIVCNINSKSVNRVNKSNNSNKINLIKSWDYSKDRYNYKGIIDIKHFLMYGIMGVVVVRIHPWIVGHVNKMF